MIKVIARNRIKAGSLPAALSLYGELVEKTVAEPGCISYELFQDHEDHDALVMVEEWESLDALDTHEKSEHFMRIFPKLKELGTGDSDFHIYRKLL